MPKRSKRSSKRRRFRAQTSQPVSNENVRTQRSKYWDALGKITKELQAVRIQILEVEYGLVVGDYVLLKNKEERLSRMQKQFTETLQQLHVHEINR